MNKLITITVSLVIILAIPTATAVLLSRSAYPVSAAAPQLDCEHEMQFITNDTQVKKYDFRVYKHGSSNTVIGSMPFGAIVEKKWQYPQREFVESIAAGYCHILGELPEGRYSLIKSPSEYRATISADLAESVFAIVETGSVAIYPWQQPFSDWPSWPAVISGTSPHTGITILVLPGQQHSIASWVELFYERQYPGIVIHKYLQEIKISQDYGYVPVPMRDR